jgi:hypothetical protein
MTTPTDVSITLPLATWLKLMTLLTVTQRDIGLDYLALIEQGLLKAGISQQAIDSFSDSGNP